MNQQDTRLLLVDLGRGQGRLGGSALAQVYAQMGTTPADVDSPALLQDFFDGIRALAQQGVLLAYHDRSDGGLFATLAEMAFAAHAGVDICLDNTSPTVAEALFNEELGAVIQVPANAVQRVMAQFANTSLNGHIHDLGQPTTARELRFSWSGQNVLTMNAIAAQQLWAQTSYQIQALRDNAECAKQEFDGIAGNDKGLHVALSYDLNEDIAAPFIHTGARPRMAILREQGVNGHVEMAAAFDRAGFTAIDVHMSDLLAGRAELNSFAGLVACGGFSYGDVLGAGGGWARSILFNARLRDQFAEFFARPDSLTLGVCNGCQMLSQLHELIPGADLWPRFERNRSEVFEARTVMVEVQSSPSLFFAGMAGSRMPVAVAHGEGRVADSAERLAALQSSGLVALAYVDGQGQRSEQYPLNPNGSPAGMTAVTSRDGRATIMMPHPERVFRAAQHSWRPEGWQEDGPWLRLFRNARAALK